MLPELELQTALYERLSSDDKLMSLLAEQGVYDYVTSETPFPYVVISEPSLVDEEVKNADVFDMSVTLHVWHNQQTSGEYGNFKPMQIKAAIYEALNYRLLLQNYEVRRVRVTQNLIFDDIDNICKHGVLTYRFTLYKKQGVTN